MGARSALRKLPPSTCNGLRGGPGVVFDGDDEPDDLCATYRKPPTKIRSPAPMAPPEEDMALIAPITTARPPTIATMKASTRMIVATVLRAR